MPGILSVIFSAISGGILSGLGSVAISVTVMVTGLYSQGDVLSRTLNSLRRPADGGPQIRIMPLGDSITEGGYNLNGIYHADDGGYRLPLERQILPRNPEIQFVGSLVNGPPDMPQKNHEGHAGWRIDEISDHVVPWLQTYQPQIILLMIGTNNMWDEEPRLDAPVQYNKLLDQIWATLPQVKVLAASIIDSNNSDVNFNVAVFNNEIHDLLKLKTRRGKDGVWVDMNHLSRITAKDLTDGVHPTAEGYAKIAKVWLEFLAPLVSIKTGL